MDECGTKSQKSSEHNRNLVNSIFQDFEAGKPQIEDNGQLEEDPGARDVNGKNVSPDCNWTSPDDEKKCDDDLKKTEGPAFVLAEIDEKSQESTEEQLEPIELDERAIKALDLKEDANKLYVDKRIEDALQLYTEALSICPVSRRKERAALYGNRSACCVQLDQHKIAIRECSKALDFDPQYLKVLKRRAKSYEKVEQLEQALEDYKKIVEMDPSDHIARERVFNLPREINERNEKLKAEMMGKLKDLGNMFLKPFGLSTNNFKLNQDPNTGGYNIQFSQNSSGE